jgi:DNA ligase 1
MWRVNLEHGSIHLPQIGLVARRAFPVPRSFVSHAHFDHLAAHREILSPSRHRPPDARPHARRRTEIAPSRSTTPWHDGPEPASRSIPPATSSAPPSACSSTTSTAACSTPATSSSAPAAPPSPAPPRAPTCSSWRRPTAARTTVSRPPRSVLGSIARLLPRRPRRRRTPCSSATASARARRSSAASPTAGLPVMLHPQTLRLTRIYEELGITFPPYREFRLPRPAPATSSSAPPQPPSPPSSAKSAPPHRHAHRLGARSRRPLPLPGATPPFRSPTTPTSRPPPLRRGRPAPPRAHPARLRRRTSPRPPRARHRGLGRLGDNQLELALFLARRRRPLPPGNPSSALRGPVPRPDPCHAPECVRAASPPSPRPSRAEPPRKLEKIALLQDYLAALPADDAALAALYFTGRAFPQSDGPRRLTTGWAGDQTAVLEVSGHARRRLPRRVSAFRRRRRCRRGPARRPPAGTPRARRPASDRGRFLPRLAAARGPRETGLLRTTFAGSLPVEAKYLVKIITGDLRIGLKEGLVEEAIAAATGPPLDAVREANMLCGDSPPSRAPRVHHSPDTSPCGSSTRSSSCSPAPSRPPRRDARPPRPPVWLEEKYDGIRCQLHKQGDRVELYSATSSASPDQFPDLARAAPAPAGRLHRSTASCSPGATAAPCPFAELQKRLGRKGDDFFLGAEIPVSILLLRPPLARRPLPAQRTAARAGRARRAAPPRDSARCLRPRPRPAGFATARRDRGRLPRARQRGNEGLMAKDPASPTPRPPRPRLAEAQKGLRHPRRRRRRRRVRPRQAPRRAQRLHLRRPRRTPIGS